MLHLENGCHTAAATPEFGSDASHRQMIVSNKYHPQKQSSKHDRVHLAMWPELTSLSWLTCTLSVCKSGFVTCAPSVRPSVKHLVYVISAAIYSVPSLKSSPIKV